MRREILESLLYFGKVEIFQSRAGNIESMFKSTYRFYSCELSSIESKLEKRHGEPTRGSAQTSFHFCVVITTRLFGGSDP